MNVIKYMLTLVLIVAVNINTPCGSVRHKEESLSNTIELIKLESKLQENEKFFTMLGLQESGNNPDTVNTIGAMGQWQIMDYTAKNFGYNITSSEFRLNPEIFPLEHQRKVLELKIYMDIKTLERQLFRSKQARINYLKEYIGTEVKGTKITLSGIVAMCHLSGAGGAMLYFDTGYSAKDIYGTNTEKYLIQFSGYKFHNPLPIRNKIKCIKQKRKDSNFLTLLERQLKLYSVVEELNDMEIPLTLNCLKKLGLQRGGVVHTKYLSELKYNYQNITEVSCTYEAQPLIAMDYQSQLVSERWSGITVRNGNYLYKELITKFLKKGQEFANSTLNRYGTRLGMSNYQIYSRRLNLSKLRNYQQPVKVLDIVADRRKYINLIKLQS